MKESNSKPCVSVIIPCYNYGNYLSDALESVQIQSLKDWECIIVDDGSSDNTRDVANQFLKADERFRYVYQKNHGLSYARNTGIRNANGKYIQFLDADDTIEFEKLKAQAHHLECHRDHALVYGDSKYFNSIKTKNHVRNLRDSEDYWTPRISDSGDKLLKRLICGNFMTVSAPLITKRLINEIGYFNEKLHSHEDWEYWLRCGISGAHFQYLGIENAGTLIRVHDTNMSQDKLSMYRSNLVVRSQLANSLENRYLKASNCEKILLYSYEASKIIFKERKLKAIEFYLKNLPTNHGYYAIFVGLLRYVFAELRSVATSNGSSRQ